MRTKSVTAEPNALPLFSAVFLQECRCVLGKPLGNKSDFADLSPQQITEPGKSCQIPPRRQRKMPAVPVQRDPLFSVKKFVLTRRLKDVSRRDHRQTVLFLHLPTGIADHFVHFRAVPVVVDKAFPVAAFPVSPGLMPPDFCRGTMPVNDFEQIG